MLQQHSQCLCVLMKSLLFNTNHLIYFFCPLLLCLILFLSVGLHYCLLSCAIDFGEYGYYNIKSFESPSIHSTVGSSLKKGVVTHLPTSNLHSLQLENIHFCVDNQYHLQNNWNVINLAIFLCGCILSDYGRVVLANRKFLFIYLKVLSHYILELYK